MFEHQDLQRFGLKLDKYEYFYPVELQVGENLNKLTKWDKG